MKFGLLFMDYIGNESIGIHVRIAYAFTLHSLYGMFCECFFEVVDFPILNVFVFEVSNLAILPRIAI